MFNTTIVLNTIICSSNWNNIRITISGIITTKMKILSTTITTVINISAGNTTT